MGSSQDLGDKRYGFMNVIRSLRWPIEMRGLESSELKLGRPLYILSERNKGRQAEAVKPITKKKPEAVKPKQIQLQKTKKKVTEKKGAKKSETKKKETKAEKTKEEVPKVEETKEEEAKEEEAKE